MNCDIYRQDYNFDPADKWKATDESEATASLKRTGVTEIKYVTGHYAFMDDILNAGYQIDNCASGGRMLDIEMMKRSIPLWRTDYTCTDPNIFTLASGIRAQGANLSWWLPISGAMASSEGLNTEYGFRSSMASGITMDVLTNQNHADKMISELLTNRPLMLGNYYILQQGTHEGLTYQDGRWVESDSTKDYIDTQNAAYEFYREDQGKGYLVAFRPYYSNVGSETYRLQGLDAHAYYEVLDADTQETNLYTGRYLMEHGLTLSFANPCTSRMIYLTKQS
jgi:alpha-galactosidase